MTEFRIFEGPERGQWEVCDPDDHFIISEWVTKREALSICKRENKTLAIDNSIQPGALFTTKRTDRKYAPLLIMARVDNWIMAQKQGVIGEGHPFVYPVQDFIEIFVNNCGYAKSN